jgi:hypothetical protein
MYNTDKAASVPLNTGFNKPPPFTGPHLGEEIPPQEWVTFENARRQTEVEVENARRETKRVEAEIAHKTIRTYVGVAVLFIALVVGAAIGLWFFIDFASHGQTTSQPTVAVPSLSPTTKSPTLPTPKPTKQPTNNPTRKPTKQPTPPTDAPTKNPTTIQPTHNPTKSPVTKSPTTKQPTLNPAISPTKSPTKKPTKHPTKNPTVSPTGQCQACRFLNSATTPLADAVLAGSPINGFVDLNLYPQPDPISECPSGFQIYMLFGAVSFYNMTGCSGWNSATQNRKFEIMQYAHSYFINVSIAWFTIPGKYLPGHDPSDPDIFGTMVPNAVTFMPFVNQGADFMAQVIMRNGFENHEFIYSNNPADYVDFSLVSIGPVCGCDFTGNYDSGQIFGTRNVYFPNDPGITVSYMDLYFACDLGVSSSQVGNSVCNQLGPSLCQAWGIISSDEHPNRALYVIKPPVAPGFLSKVYLETGLPTTNPTLAPGTLAPSSSPVFPFSPTMSPTITGDTMSPTLNPSTLVPTSNPTLYPTTVAYQFLTNVDGMSGVYCSALTLYPTLSPTPPTNKPTTANPTKNTKSPTTKQPTIPTNSPTVSPQTDSPTKNPSRHPTKNPTTRAPTKHPTTVAPTTKSPTTTMPTKNPTNFPNTNPTTATPTANPTKPTVLPTNHPTAKPTNPGANLYLYSDQVLYTSSTIGNKATADARCENYGTNVLQLGCDYYVAFVSYGASSEIRDFPSIYGFNRDTSQIYSALNPSTGICFYGALWQYCITDALGQSVFLQTSLAEAGILPANTNFWSASYESVDGAMGTWARTQSCTASPTVSPTATSFSGGTGYAQVGNSSIGYNSPQSTRWLAGQTIPCSGGEAYVLCACILFYVN